MANKENFLKFDQDGFASCRQCGGLIGKRDGRNFRAGFLDASDAFKTVLILSNQASFRCPFCYTYHDFLPFKKPSAFAG